MESFRKDVIANLAETIEKDEFDDSYQNKDFFDNEISGNKAFIIRNVQKGNILDIGCGSNEMGKYIKITHGIDPNKKRLNNNEETNIEIKEGWAENLPYNDNEFDNIICWGTFCFVRSDKEALYEFNRVLKIGGILIFDVIEETSLPIARTVNIDSFINFLKLFGFKLLERKNFSDKETYLHKRVALSVMKFEEFDYKNFLMPQSVGKINNYNEKRDWYMR
jgi:ubiquinone/menaquinone biosynthesis C-methylase UbiE